MKEVAALEPKRLSDPIIEEVRAAREALFREAGYDLDRLHERLMASQERHGDRLIRVPLGTIPSVDKTS